MSAPGDPAVAAALHRLGLDPDSARGRDRATPKRCPRCRAHILVGLDSDVAALSAAVDPGPLTIRDEATALLAGRRTYRLAAHGRRLVLRYRDRWQITGQPPGTVHVVAEHRCGAVLAPPPAADRQEPASGPAPY